MYQREEMEALKESFAVPRLFRESLARNIAEFMDAHNIYLQEDVWRCMEMHGDVWRCLEMNK